MAGLCKQPLHAGTGIRGSAQADSEDKRAKMELVSLMTEDHLQNVRGPNFGDPWKTRAPCPIIIYVSCFALIKDGEGEQR